MGFFSRQGGATAPDRSGNGCDGSHRLGDDAGFPNTTGAGWIVKTQRDRGLYQHYALGCLEAGNCVGWHWFKYLDNDVNDPKADSSNRDSNKGIVRLDYTPYVPVLDLMRPLNREVYPLTAFFDARR